MKQTVIEALEKQANHEFTAAHDYRALAYWCEANDYSGFAKFFLEQSAEEVEHAEKIISHLLDRGAHPALLTIEAPRKDYEAIVDIAQMAYDLERANTAGIEAAYEVALAEKDYPAQVMLHWFISEQVEEEAWTAKMLGKTKTAQCSGATSWLDRHIIKELRDPEEE